MRVCDSVGAREHGACAASGRHLKAQRKRRALTVVQAAFLDSRICSSNVPPPAPLEEEEEEEDEVGSASQATVKAPSSAFCRRTGASRLAPAGSVACTLKRQAHECVFFL